MNSCDDTTCGSSGGTTRPSRIPRPTARRSTASQRNQTVSSDETTDSSFERAILGHRRYSGDQASLNFDWIRNLPSEQNSKSRPSQGIINESRRASFPQSKSRAIPCPARGLESSGPFSKSGVGGTSFLTQSQREDMQRQLAEVQEYYKTPLEEWRAQQNRTTSGSSRAQICPGTTCPGASSGTLRRQPRAPASTGRQPRAPASTGRQPRAPASTGRQPRAPASTGRQPVSAASRRSPSASPRPQSGTSRRQVCPESTRAHSASRGQSRTQISSKTQLSTRPKSSTTPSSSFRGKQPSPRTSKNVTHSSEDDFSFGPPLLSSTMREPQPSSKNRRHNSSEFTMLKPGPPCYAVIPKEMEPRSTDVEYTYGPQSTKICYSPGYLETTETSGDEVLGDEMMKKGLEMLSGDDPTKIPTLNLEKSTEDQTPRQKKKSSFFKSFMHDSSQSQSESSRSSPQQRGSHRGSSSSPRGSSGSPRGTSSSQEQTSSDDRGLWSQSQRSQLPMQTGRVDNSCICPPTSPQPGPSHVPDAPEPISYPAFPIENWQTTEEDVTALDLDLERATEEEVRRVKEALGPDAGQFELMEALCAAGVPEVVIEREMAKLEEEQCTCNVDSEEFDDICRKVEKLIDEETKDIETALMLYRDEIEERRRQGDDFGIVRSLRLPEKRSTYSLRRQLRQMHKQVRPYTIVEGDEPEDIHPDVAAAMMHTEEIGLHLGDTPEKMYSYLFKTKYSGIAKVDVLPGEEDSAVPGRMTSMADGTFMICDTGREDIEEPPSTEVYSKTVGSPPVETVDERESGASVTSELGRVKDYFLEASAPAHYTRVQLRGSVIPDWFPGYMEAGTILAPNEIRLTCAPSRVLKDAWIQGQPENFQKQNVKVIAEDENSSDEECEDEEERQDDNDCLC